MLRYNGTNPFLAPGSLLAIPPADADSVRTATTPGEKIKQALVDYGGYLVDDTACDSVSERRRRPAWRAASCTPVR